MFVVVILNNFFGKRIFLKDERIKIYTAISYTCYRWVSIVFKISGILLCTIIFFICGFIVP